jgi:hypothetical protein
MVVTSVLVTVAKAVHVGVGTGNFDEQKETAGLYDDKNRSWVYGGFAQAESMAPTDVIRATNRDSRLATDDMTGEQLESRYRSM